MVANPTRLFISQKRIDAWIEDNRIQIEGETMTLVEDGRAFAMMPAVRFMAVAGGGDDPHDLLGRVKTEAALDEMGADHYMDSVILGDTAYDVQTGFVGLPRPRGG